MKDGRLFVRTLAIVIMIGACNKSDGRSTPPIFEQFGDGGRTKWNGAWVIAQPRLFGVRQAWQVKGDEVTVFDGAEKTYTFEIESPCSLRIDGGSTVWHYQYVWERDTLYAGLGAAGFRKGDDAIVCGLDFDIFVIKGGKCQVCKKDVTRWSCNAAECSLAGDTFEATSTVDGTKHRLKVEGNLILSDQMAGNKADKKPDFAAAKAAR